MKGYPKDYGVFQRMQVWNKERLHVVLIYTYDIYYPT